MSGDPALRSPLRDSGSRVVLAAFAVIGVLLAAFTVRAVVAADRYPAVFDAGVYNAIVILSGAVCLARGLLVREERTAWLLLGLGAVAFAAGDLYYTLALADLETQPFPSAADALYLTFYPLAYVALGLLVRSRIGSFSASMWADGLVAGLTVAAVAAAVVFEVVLRETEGTPLAVATNLMYPLADALLLAIVVGVLALTGWRPGWTWSFIGIGLGLFAVADSVYLFQISRGSYVEGTVVDVGWAGGLVLAAVAAWTPYRRRATAAIEGWGALAIPFVCALGSLGILVLDHFDRVNVAALFLAAAALIAVLARLVATFRENLEMLRASRREAHTDALTGLRNRRALLVDLARAAGGDGGRHALVLFDLDGFKFYNDTFGHPAGDALLARLARKLDGYTRGRGSAYRMGGDEFCVLLDLDGQPLEQLVRGAAAALSESGDGFSIGASYGTALIPDETVRPPEALRLADFRMYAHKHRTRPLPGVESSSVLVRALAERDPAVGEHVAGVAELAEAVAERLGCDHDQREQIRLAALVHDVGKMAVPEAILTKPGPLTEEEQAFIHRHPLVGEKILQAAPSLARVAKIVRSSHERWDGGGYPDGLAGEEIPLGARIVFVCDAFDAMLTDRPYSRARNLDAALAEIERCAGTQFDPRVVATFLAVVDERRREDREAA